MLASQFHLQKPNLSNVGCQEFDMTPSEYKKFKGLKRENLRDHMDDLELIFSMLGEAATTEIAKTKDTQGFVENKKAAVSLAESVKT